MKKITYIIFLALFAVTSCDVDYYDNPNAPQTPPTSALFNDAVHQSIVDTRDEWFLGRFTQVTMQYWQQSEYGDEDRYVYRESMRQTWQDFYMNAENLRKVIQFNSDEDTKDAAAAYGDNNNQIQCARIMLAWNFNLMADTWGDIPYYSFGSDNADFQALQLADSEEEIMTPKYATQDQIYTDIMNVLQDAADKLDATKPGFLEGDVIYGGDVSKWKKFANSLRLRIANKMGNTAHINDAIADGVFESNADNAMFQFETSDKNAAPMYQAWNVDMRSDFAVSHSFITLLEGENMLDTLDSEITTNPFAGLVDPRLSIYAQPNDSMEYVGMFIASSSAEAAPFIWESLPGNSIINKPDYAVTLMEYAEVEFILSELNSWDQTHYENGVTASMQKWGVPQSDINDYIAAMPAANEENVLTQKYIALYMQGHTAWMEYRRTGYPKTLIMPGDTYKVVGDPDYPDKTTYKEVFTPLIQGITDLPTRMRYPQYEQTLNGENRAAAVEGLSNGDAVTSKLIWDTN